MHLQSGFYENGTAMRAHLAISNTFQWASKEFYGSGGSGLPTGKKRNEMIYLQHLR
jgi:hypothetical protein